MGLLKAIIGRVDLDGSGFERGAIKVENAAARLGKNVAGELKGAIGGAAAAFGVEAITSGVLEIVERVHQLSKEFRASTDDVQRWDIAAHKVGEQAETVGSAINKLKKAREEALNGNIPAIEAFGRLGVSMDMIRDRANDAGAIIKQMVDYVSGRPIMDDEDVAGMELFGKSGAVVLSIFQQLHALGPVKLIQEKDIEALHNAEAAWKRLKTEVVADTAGPMAAAMNFLAVRWKTAMLNTKMLFGKVSYADAKKELGDLKSDIGGNAGNGDSSKAPEHTSATFVVDLHKDDEEINKRRLALIEKIRDSEYAGLTIAQKKNALQKEIAALEDKAQRELYQGNLKEAGDAEVKAMERKADLATLMHRNGGLDFHADALARIGGSIGSVENATTQINRQQLDVARQHVNVSKQILNALTGQIQDGPNQSLVE